MLKKTKFFNEPLFNFTRYNNWMMDWKMDRTWDVQFYTFVMLLVLPDELHIEKPELEIPGPGPTDGPTDRPTDGKTLLDRDARTHLKWK